ncbi:MAG: arylesterase [Gammaproteobacteria bacterium]
MMNIFSRLMLATLLCLSAAFHHTVFAADKTPPNILVMGDSLSGAYGIDRQEGWVTLLQQTLQQRGYAYTVINASISGDTSRTGLSRLEDALRAHRPEIVIVALGGNDGLRGLPFAEIQSSLARIIERAQQAGAQILLVGVRLPPNYGVAYNQQFANMYRELAHAYDVALVPRILNDVADHPELMQADGIHPTQAAQARILQNVWQGLQPLLRQTP